MNYYKGREETERGMIIAVYVGQWIDRDRETEQDRASERARPRQI